MVKSRVPVPSLAGHCTHHALYLAMKEAWNFRRRPMTPSIFDSGGRNVMRKWKVPSLCLNPLPGTVTIPVFWHGMSNPDKQIGIMVPQVSGRCAPCTGGYVSPAVDAIEEGKEEGACPGVRIKTT